MPVTLYNFDNFSDASVSSTETNALLTNKSSGDNAYTIINNMGVTSITFISSSALNPDGANLADKQVGDILLVYGPFNAQKPNGWKSAVVGSVPTSGVINWKVVTSDDVDEVIPQVTAGYDCIFRPNAPIKRVAVNEYNSEAAADRRP